MNREFIVQEIKRTAAENGGMALGRQRFEKATGIKQTDWLGKYWTRWGDAVVEAGYTPNVLQGAFNEADLITLLAALTRELGHFPVEAELRMKARNARSFPSRNVFEKLGPKRERAKKVLAYCIEHGGLDDVANICRPLVEVPVGVVAGSNTRHEAPAGYVYLVQSGRYFKIGHTASMGRREYELALQLPEKVKLVHALTTDDPAGIEAYWHKRFGGKRKNGEWFELSATDVSAFKRRKFM